MDKEMTASEETPAAEIACARSSILYFLLFDGFVRGMFEDVIFLSPTLLLGGGGGSAHERQRVLFVLFQRVISHAVAPFAQYCTCGKNLV